MKRKYWFLVGLLLGAILGWMLGYLRLPYFHINKSFNVGLFAGAFCVLTLLVLYFLFKRNQHIIKQVRLNTPLKKNYTRAWAITSSIIIIGGLTVGVLLFQVAKQERELKETVGKYEQSNMSAIQQKRISNLLALMKDLQEDIEMDLSSNPERMMSDNMLEKIKLMNKRFEPYYSDSGDSLSDFYYSEERGLLLQILLNSGMNEHSLEIIKKENSFSMTDLNGSDLSEKDLSGIILSHSNFKNANLSGTNLNKANLAESDFWGAKLNDVMAIGANFMNADLKWSEVNGGNLTGSMISGADFSNAKLRNATLDSSYFEVCDFYGAILDSSNFKDAYSTWAKFERTSCKAVNFSGTNLRKVKMNEANLTGAILTDIGTDNEDWIEELDSIHVDGNEEIKRLYKIVENPDGHGKYKLVLK